MYNILVFSYEPGSTVMDVDQSATMIDRSVAWITGWIFARLQTTSSWLIPYSLFGL